MQRVTGNSKNYMKSYLVIAVALPLLFVILNGAYGQYGYGTLHISANSDFYELLWIPHASRHVERPLHLSCPLSRSHPVSNLHLSSYHTIFNFSSSMKLLDLELFLFLVSSSLTPLFFSPLLSLDRWNAPVLFVPVRRLNHTWKPVLLHSPHRYHSVRRYLLYCSNVESNLRQAHPRLYRGQCSPQWEG